jgi:hypothetical protein
MTNKRVKLITALSEAEVSRALRLEAVRRGLRLPETPEEIAIFEVQFSDEILEAGKNLPSLESVCARAKGVRSAGLTLIEDMSPVDVEPSLAMAARNGADIPSKVEEQMRLALAEAKGRKKPDGN